MRLGSASERTVEVVSQITYKQPPAAPAHTFLQGKAASRKFGSFTYRLNGDGTITQSASWVRRYITTRKVPILGAAQCHRLLFPQLSGALGEIERAGLAGAIDVEDFRHGGGGCYMPRQQLWDPKLPLSMHAWGIALDINVARNAYGAEPRQDPRVVEIFERWGFRWGGHWSPPDGMHFELGALLAR